MRLTPTQTIEYTSPRDPTEPATVWSISAITYTDTLDAQREAGPVPVRGLTALRGDNPDDPAADAARDWLARYDLAICARGIKAIDGEQRSCADIRAALDSMRPTSAVRLVLSDIALKIAELSAGDPAKKD